MKNYAPNPTVGKERQSTTAVSSKPLPQPSRPSLKLVIPNTGKSAGEKSMPLIKVAKPPPSQRTEEKGNVVKPKQPASPKVPPPASQISRPTLPAPTILLQPPTPPAGRLEDGPAEKLQLAESPMHESPSGIPLASAQNPSSSKLSPPPSPPPMEPVALPGTSAEAPFPSVEPEAQRRRPSFIFKIPPVKPSNKPLSRKTDVRGRNSLESLSTLSSDSMFVDDTHTNHDMAGLDLGMMFDSPSRENPSGGLPSHLQPKVVNQMGELDDLQQFSLENDFYKPPPPLSRGFGHGGEIVATLPMDGSLDSKHAIEKRIRPSLVKLFGTSVYVISMQLILC